MLNIDQTTKLQDLIQQHSYAVYATGFCYGRVDYDDVMSDCMPAANMAACKTAKASSTRSTATHEALLDYVASLMHIDFGGAK